MRPDDHRVFDGRRDRLGTPVDSEDVRRPVR
jgi:hypothetical protein